MHIGEEAWLLVNLTSRPWTTLKNAENNSSSSSFVLQFLMRNSARMYKKPWTWDWETHRPSSKILLLILANRWLAPVYESLRRWKDEPLQIIVQNMWKNSVYLVGMATGWGGPGDGLSHPCFHSWIIKVWTSPSPIPIGFWFSTRLHLNKNSIRR